MFLVGAVMKRAQVPFSAWLPAAMAAPTPVSSLVHSSTLVTAGVYVLVRFNYIFFSLNWVNTISCITMIVSGLAAAVEKDLKKVIAMSTLRQLSVIFFSLSMGLWKLAFLHVLLHALYKSLLFLGCGRMILRLLGRQDSRGFGFSFGGFGKLCFFSSSVRLVGLPFAVGFFSKDLIILLISFNSLNFFNMIIFFIGCLLTVFYRMRLIYYGFFLEPTFSPYVEN
jgi:NADH-ubiquinone oxidoreductase chain 5